jgi:LysM repeat protein
MHYTKAGATIAVLFALGYAGDAAAKNSHVVSSGDTLWDISRSYGCDVQAIRQVNALGSERLDVGQELTIPSCEDRQGAAEPPAEDPELVTHVIASGDTLSEIATHYKTSVRDLVKRNELRDSTILAGARLVVLPGSAAGDESVLRDWQPEPEAIIGQSVGLPHHGRLKKAIRLKQGKGYYIRRPERSFGASQTVGYLTKSVAQVRRRFPHLHDLAIGDLSAKKGGKITMHASHQNGRDVDIGFYFKEIPKGYPESFVVATPKNIDFKASWALLTQFTDLAKKPNGVDRIFMSYSSQKMFYKLARKSGVSKKKLKEVFQYPAGKWSKQGVVHHEPAHDEHFHVRFKCAPKDDGCR